MTLRLDEKKMYRCPSNKPLYIKTLNSDSAEAFLAWCVALIGIVTRLEILMAGRWIWIVGGWNCTYGLERT